ncbi:hypothetical protein [Glutamicibacter sp. FBE19]|uniref:8-oxoguanine DNA glycosylase OGG fold protein n=1 Tax=Glutamicibacter sp. FBE19 TaxID=2761534 RepID=UPI00189643C3|nr:hypothetical protein [Glutamicibacter sp. FBE19]MBF6672585.1 hypothetical protein [Glutamicibacter sp. FBE19]
MTRTRKTTAEVVDLLRNGKGLPTAAEVDNHAIWFYPRHWLNRWDENMPDVPSILQSGEKDSKGRLTLSRGDLFALGNKVKTAQDAVNFYVAVCSWGAGAKARDIYRRIPTLSEPDVGEKLLDGIMLAQDPNVEAEEAYRSFWTSNQYKLKGLGPAFFTKLLYFTAGPTDSQKMRHLILDKKVAASIGWPDKAWWTPSEYGNYLELINNVVEHLPEAERSDCLEMRLFKP